jgi:hypothetical protein
MRNRTNRSKLEILNFERRLLVQKCAASLSVGGVAQLSQKRHQRIEDIVIMKAMLTILVLASLALMASGADAQKRSRYSRGETPQYQSSGGLYDSLSQGRQSYPNYDRETNVNRSYGDWKTVRKAHRKPIKH